MKRTLLAVQQGNAIGNGEEGQPPDEKGKSPEIMMEEYVTGSLKILFGDGFIRYQAADQTKLGVWPHLEKPVSLIFFREIAG